MLAFAATCALGCNKSTPADQTGTVRVPVETLQLRQVAIRPSARAVADLLARRRVVVAAETAGRVQRLWVDVGHAVRAGQRLVRLDATKTGHNLSLVRAEQQQTRAALDQAERHHRRIQKLAKRGVATQAQLDDADSAVQLARARLHANKARLGLTGTQLRDSQVRAPFAGTVQERHVELGDFVSPGRPLLTLVDATSLKARAGVSVADALRIRPGDMCRLELDEQSRVDPRRFDGTVKSVATAANPRTRRINVEVTVDNADGLLRPGMIAEVTCFTGPPRDTIAVPASAVVEQFEVSYAFVAHKGRARRRRVNVRGQRGALLEVESGLEPGEALVVVGQENLTDGTAVRVVRQATQPPDLTPQPSPARSARAEHPDR